MEGDDFCLQLRLNFHPSGFKADDLISSHDRSVPRRTAIDILDAGPAELILRIVAEAQKEGAAGSHDRVTTNFAKNFRIG